jgi:uncharacterized RDD family membrane protein YckC
MYQKVPDIGSRLASAFMDYFLGFLLKSIVFIVFLLSIRYNNSDPAVAENPFLLLIQPSFAVAYIFATALYFMKDMKNGRSVGKRAVGLQLVNNKTGLVAAPLQTVLRSLGFILWIAEVILIFASPSRRLGDFLSGTKVVEAAPAQKLIFPFYHYLLAFLLALVLACTSYFPLLALGRLANIPIAPSVYYGPQEEVKEEVAQTEDLSEFFKTKYTEEFESVILSSQTQADNSQLITGTFMLRQNLFDNGEIDVLMQKVKADLDEKMSGKKFSTDIAFIFMGLEDDTTRMEKLEYSSGE